MEEKEKGKRPRIVDKPKELSEIDGLNFFENKSSKNARKVESTKESIDVQIWFDKHYIIRNQHGDDNGKRDGIGSDVVQKLVLKSIKHLLAYSSHLKGFNFLKIDNGSNAPHRVILQEYDDVAMLNVIIDAHLIGIDTYEITVITAMCVDDFRIFDGQYVVEIQGDNSVLYKKENKNLKEVCTLAY